MAMNERAKRRHARIMIWTAVIIVFGAMFLPLTGYLYVDLVSAEAANAEQTNPRANYWRAVREGNAGYVASQGPYTTNTLVQNGGQNWRQVRNGPIATYGPWLLAIVVLAIGIFHISTSGGIKLGQPRSGKTVLRWTLGERVLHWYTAILFIILAVSGLSLLFGKAVLIPLLGKAGFAAWANLAMTVHNYLGPFFVVGVLLEVLWWIRHNIPNATDMKWFAKGGGFVGSGHPPAGRMNGGEKVWFWIIATVGVAVCVTGLILNFPNFEQTRETMQLASTIHAITGMIWVAVALGHIYIGTAGSEGSLEAMTTGRVSSEWAKQHHDQWYEEVKHTEEATSTGASGTVARQPG